MKKYKKGSGRVIRGGNWFFNAALCRVANRYSLSPNYRSNRTGFRLVRNKTTAINK